MARSGLYKSDVKKARDSLLAQNKHPSVDSVRIALGNTGSKTTIHHYLRELAEETGGADARKTSVSEALHDLVARLAAQLQEEAEAQINTLRNEHAIRNQEQMGELAAASQKAGQLREHSQHIELSLKQEQELGAATRGTLQQETIARHIAQQHVAGLQERLAENEAHRLSLEEKHRHTREALEHYRQSIKEQRDQDQRRHEQQIQQLQAELRQAQQTVMVKQEEVTRLNQEGVRLVADLSQARQALHEEQENGRRLMKKMDSLQSTEQRNGALAAQLADKEQQMLALSQQHKATSEQVVSLFTQIRDLELALAQSQAKCEAQQGLTAELSSYLKSVTFPAVRTTSVG